MHRENSCQVLSCHVRSRRVESCLILSGRVVSPCGEIPDTWNEPDTGCVAVPSHAAQCPAKPGRVVSPPHHASSGEGSFASSYPHLRQTSVPSARTYTDPLSHRGHTGRGIFVVVAFLCIHTHTHTKNISLSICVLTGGFQKKEVISVFLERHI